MNTSSIEEKEKEPVRTATIVGIVSIVLNLVLGLSKITIGQIMGFHSVFSDGVHGTGDVLTTIIAVISIWIAARKKNDKYNYGYERWSSIAGIVLAIILFVTSITIITEAITSLVPSSPTLRHGAETEGIVAGTPLFWVSMGLSIASVVLKEIMFYVTYYGARKAHSTAMKADAWHQRVDALSSIAAIIALSGYYWLPENNILDPIFSLPIAFMVIVIGVKTFVKSARELTDHAIDAEKLKKVQEVLARILPPERIKLIRSRIYSEKFYLDIFVLLDPKTSLKEADDLSDNIKRLLFSSFDDLKDVYVIIEPDDDIHRKQEETIH